MTDEESHLRFARAYIRGAIRSVGQLQPTDYDSALDTFRHHSREAIHVLEEWAKANGIDISTQIGVSE